MSDDAGRNGHGPTTEYERPPGVVSSFAPRPEPPAYAPPPPTISPEERAAFGRPPGGGPFAPLTGERLPPQHHASRPASPGERAAFAAPPQARDGFDPAPGTRLRPHGSRPESPWWTPNAVLDPWRDPSAPFWLGRGAVFTRGRAAQVDPADDIEADPALEVEPAEALDDDSDDELGTTNRGRVVRRIGWNGFLLALVIALAAGGIGGGVGFWLTRATNDQLHKPDVTLAKGGTPANRPPGSVAAIASKVGPSVVSIAVTTPSEYAVGSGVVIDGNGYVLTNNHVVSAAKTGGTIVVTFSDEATADAKIVGLDPISDLAVLKVPASSLTVAALGDSSLLQVGDPVIAIGSPLGLEGTVTSGIVSALDRAVHVPAQDGNTDTYLDAVQTDAAINPGNSGGALVAADGTVVGINSAVAASADSTGSSSTIANGIGYAIPINYARTIAQQLIRTGTAVHASIGAQGRTAAAGLRVGAYLVQIAPGGAADKAGLRAGDVIVVAQGKMIVSYDQLAVLVQQAIPGEAFAVTYFRGAAKKTATLTLDKL